MLQRKHKLNNDVIGIEATPLPHGEPPISTELLLNLPVVLYVLVTLKSNPHQPDEMERRTSLLQYIKVTQTYLLTSLHV